MMELTKERNEEKEKTGSAKDTDCAPFSLSHCIFSNHLCMYGASMLAFAVYKISQHWLRLCSLTTKH